MRFFLWPTAEACQYFSCLPPFTGKTVAGGPSHLVGLNSTFRCCSVRPGSGDGPGAIAAWYGGPPGSSLVLQKHVHGPHGSDSWNTAAKVVGKGTPALSKLCYSTGNPLSTSEEYRLFQSADPKRGINPRTFPWVVWLDKASYLGTSAVVTPDSRSLGKYPQCP